MSPWLQTVELCIAPIKRDEEAERRALKSRPRPKPPVERRRPENRVYWADPATLVPVEHGAWVFRGSRTDGDLRPVAPTADPGLNTWVEADARLLLATTGHIQATDCGLVTDPEEGKAARREADLERQRRRALIHHLRLRQLALEAEGGLRLAAPRLPGSEGAVSPVGQWGAPKDVHAFAYDPASGFHAPEGDEGGKEDDEGDEERGRREPRSDHLFLREVAHRDPEMAVALCRHYVARLREEQRRMEREEVRWG